MPPPLSQSGVIAMNREGGGQYPFRPTSEEVMHVRCSVVDLVNLLGKEFDQAVARKFLMDRFLWGSLARPL